MWNLRSTASCFFAVLAVVIPKAASAEVTVFENDDGGWLSAAGQPALLNFDSVPGSTSQPLAGDEFSGFPGSPLITAAPLSETPDVFVGDPTTQVDAPSLPNMLFPTCDSSCEGIVTVEFDTPIFAISALFLDVEADFASTGYSITPNSPVPEYSFSSSQGQASVAFLGIVSDTPFSSVDIHFSTGANIDGVLIDDLRYSLVKAVPALGRSGGVLLGALILACSLVALHRWNGT